MENFAYVRISTTDQKEDRQLDALSVLNIPSENIYIDKQSGKDFERPAYKTLISRLSSGDLVYIKSIDRLGRGYDGIIEQWRLITKEYGADIVVLDMPLLDTRREKNLMGTFITDTVLQLLSFVAQTERENMLQRQAEGIVAAKARGKQFGRPSKVMPENFESIVQLWENKQISLAKVLEECGDICSSTFFSWLKRYREKDDLTFSYAPKTPTFSEL